MSTENVNKITTKRHVLAQVVICKGCCCGQTDKGRPGVPEEQIKSIWKSERLNKTIQLTISGCLGPCDVANVVQIITPEGTEWFGKIERAEHYEALFDWARTCHLTGRIVSRPVSLLSLQFDGYIQES